MTLTIGIDVGGTKIAGGVVDEQGRVLEQLRVESPAQDAAAMEEVIAGLVARLRVRHEVEAVGVGVAGFIDRRRSVVLFAPNLAWRDLDLKTELEERIDVPVVIENDANAAAWGEFRFGAGEDVDDLVLITVGTGVGGGLVLDGALHRGAFGVAAELGHLRVVPGGRLCGCGNRGCWEQYGSGTALVRTAREEAAAGSMLARPLIERAGSVEAIDGPMITAAAEDGDPFAIEQLADLGRWLGEGVASLTAVLDPAVVVVGGGVAAAGDLLMTPLRASFRKELTGRGHRPELQIRTAALGNTAGLIGAADLARERGA